MTVHLKSGLPLRPSMFTGTLTRPFPGLPAILLVGLWMGMTTVALAHDANVATIKVIRQPANIWVFELQTPLPALDESMRRFNEARARDHGDLAADSTRYKEQIVEYVKATFQIDTDAVADGASPSSIPALGSGRIKLTDHVSILNFEIENMPVAFDELTLQLPYMADNPGQQDILWLIDGDRSQTHVLRAGNEFTVVDTDFFDSDSSTRQGS